MAKTNNDADDGIDKFIFLLVEYGNASFDCGEYDGSEYDHVLQKAISAKLACIHWVNCHTTLNPPVNPGNREDNQQ